MDNLDIRRRALAWWAIGWFLAGLPGSVARAEEGGVVRVEFAVDPPSASVWQRDFEGNYNYLGPTGQRLNLPLGVLETRGERKLLVDFQVPLWFSTWTSQAEELSVPALRQSGRFPTKDWHRLPLSAGQRFQAATRAHPVLSLLGLSLPLGLLGAVAYARRRERPSSPAAGTIQVQGYTLGERLGAGAMGEVFAARSHEGTSCALKLLRPDVGNRPGAAERFDREISASIALSHPNLLAVYGYGFTSDGRLYLASELLLGQNLKDYLKRRDRLSPPELALEVIEQIGSALDYLHRAGFVHRDVKPENIFVRSQDQSLVLMDLGIAQGQGAKSLTADGRAMGTPAYMSPEQVLGKPRAESDQYALGIVLYEVLTGQRPFRALDVSALAHQQIHETPDPPSVLERRIPPLAEAAILRMMAKDPEARFPSLEEARQVLADVLLDQHWTVG